MSVKALSIETLRQVAPRAKRVLRRCVQALTTPNFAAWERPVALILTAAALIAGGLTYSAFADLLPFGKSADGVFWLLQLDLIILFLLMLLVARRVTLLVMRRQRGQAGSRLHLRIVLTFSLLTAVPAVLIALFSAFFFFSGVQTWFGDQVRAAVTRSHAVAQAYLEEHRRVIQADVFAMAQDLDRSGLQLYRNPRAFADMMQTQTFLRNFREAIVFDSRGRLLSAGGVTLAVQVPALPPTVIDNAQSGEVVLLTADDDSLQAVIRLNALAGSYLYVSRFLDPTVLSYVQDTKDASLAYAQLEARQSALQITVTVIFIVVALLLLLAAIWFGLSFAESLIQPIQQLAQASERIRLGDLSTRLPDVGREDEFDTLFFAFNRMTEQLRTQQDDLLMANRHLVERRHFVETVLSGVTSGVLAFGPDRIVQMSNAAAARLLGRQDQLIGRSIDDVMTGLGGLKAGSSLDIPYLRPDGQRRFFLVRLAAWEGASAVLTFDDITDLQSAQRKAAWADVARRIAHEIKNPLTPIQLSAERLQRRLAKSLQGDDQRILLQASETIQRHVADIARMVGEFAAFARMPEPLLQTLSLNVLVRDTLASFQSTYADTDWIVAGVDDPVNVRADEGQIRQALSNIVLNALDITRDFLIREHPEIRPRIGVHVCVRDRLVWIIVADNGPGFPKGVALEQLTEPYVTFREKGTGLGLAIVKKIMDDHGGQLVLGAPDLWEDEASSFDIGGALVALALPKLVDPVQNL